MNGPIAQTVAITSFGNAKLLKNIEPKFNLENSTAKFCERIQFKDLVKNGFWNIIFKKTSSYTERIIALDFTSWLDFLRSQNVKRLYLHYIRSNSSETEERMTSGFIGGGGRWLIEANKGKSSDYWEARWEAKNQNAKNNRFWEVTYTRIACNDIVRKNLSIGVSGLIAELRNSLMECIEFSQKNQLDSFRELFDSAIACLEKGDFNSEYIYHKDFIPDEYYRNEVKRILFASQPAWVFGGMGSWNDMGFEKDKQIEYERISNRLYNLLCKSIAHATNELQ